MNHMNCRTMRAAIFLLLWTWVISPQSHGQIPTPAPAAPEEPANSKVGYKVDPARELLTTAVRSFEAKDFKTAAEALERALENGPVAGMPQELTQATCELYADVLCELHDYPAAIHVLNVLSRTRPADDLLFHKRIIHKRIDAYEQQMWSNAMFDEARFAVRIDPTDTSAQKKLLIGLIYEPCPTLRNPTEVLSILNTMESRIDEIPTIARLIAVTAAETGDFDRAVRMQQRYIDSGSSDDVDGDSELMECYKQRLNFVPPMPPEVDPGKLLTREELANEARSCMVRVRVHGVIECQDATGENKMELGVAHEHIGTVIDSLGTILVCEETVRLPRYEEIDPSDVAGTTRWSKGPDIEVYSIPDNNADSKSLGKAQLIGTDEATGIALIEMERKSSFQFARLEQKAARFAPEYRSVNRNSEPELSRTFELVVQPFNSSIGPTLREIRLSSDGLVAADDSSESEQVSFSVKDINAGEVPIGTPFFNQLGECIGIRDQELTDDQGGVFSIPSSVCIRVTAKLSAYGSVPRTDLKFIVKSARTNSRVSSRGMLVSTILDSRGSVYEPLAGKIIVSLDGCSTPTIVEWLGALERSFARGLKTIEFGVYETSTESIEIRTFPTPGDSSR